MKVYRIKAYSNANGSHLHRQITQIGVVRNYAISMMELYYRLFKKTLSSYDLSKHITKMKKRDCRTARMVAGLDAQSVQEELGRVFKGYKKFFSFCDKKKSGDVVGRRFRPPKMRKASRNKSFTLKQTGYKFNDDRTKVTVLGKRYGFFKSQEIKGRIKRITIKRDSVGDIWFLITTDFIETEERQRTGRSAGFDFGLKTYLTSSDGCRIENPQFLKSDMQKFVTLSRMLSRKKIGSNNRRKARHELSRFYRRIVNRRNDWQWKTARLLVETYDKVCFEDIAMSGMSSLWGRKVADLAFSSFLFKVEHLARKSGVEFVKVGRFFASSQVCNVCGYKNEETKDLNVRAWTCPRCGSYHDRDVNAAMNILREGASSHGRGSVRPVSEMSLARTAINPQSQLFRR